MNDISARIQIAAYLDQVDALLGKVGSLCNQHGIQADWTIQGDGFATAFVFYPKTLTFDEAIAYLERVDPLSDEDRILVVRALRAEQAGEGYGADDREAEFSGWMSSSDECANH